MENIKIPNIDKKECLRVIDTINFVDDERFTYNGTNFLFLNLEESDIENNEMGQREDTFYSYSTLINGFDIYMLDNLSLDQKKRRLYHEMVECNLRDQGFEEEEAHNCALRSEEEIFGKRENNSNY